MAASRRSRAILRPQRPRDTKDEAQGIFFAASVSFPVPEIVEFKAFGVCKERRSLDPYWFRPELSVGCF